MPRAKIMVDALTFKRAEQELERIKDGKLAIQLKAILASAEHPVDRVASVIQVSVRSIFRWVSKFKEEGISGLKDRPKGHMKSKLTQEQLVQIEEWIVKGKNSQEEPIHWTLAKLQKEIERIFGIHIGITPLWKHMRRQGFVLKRPRPVHVKANPEAQEAFKKNYRKKCTPKKQG